MPVIIIENLHSKTIHCKSKSKRLLDILLEETDWMHACGGKGKCTTCVANIISGEAGMSDYSETELKMIKLGKIGEQQRQTCQAFVESGTIVLNVPEAYQLPHLNYSN